MSPIIFGSPEAAAVVKRDRDLCDKTDPEHAPLHRWRVTTVGMKRVESAYIIDAATAEQAREIWHNGGGELLFEETTADADDYDCEITEIADEGEVKG